MKPKLLLISLLFIMSSELFAARIGRFGADFTASSDYIYRGVSRTDHSPQLVGNMYYKFNFGLRFGASTGNVGADSNRGMEARIYTKYKKLYNRYFGIKSSVEYFNNPYATNGSSVIYELGFMITKYFELSVYYAPKYLGTEASSLYCEASTYFPLMRSQKLYLRLSGGYSQFDDEILAGNLNYADYKIAIHKKIRRHDISLFFVGTNRRIYDGAKIDDYAEDEGFGAAYVFSL